MNRRAINSVCGFGAAGVLAIAAVTGAQPEPGKAPPPAPAVPPTSPAPSAPAAPQSKPAADPSAATPAPADGKPQEGKPADPAAKKDAVKTAENAALENEITPELDEAINKGIAFLISEQQADGSFGSGRYSKNVAVTALACIALLADGNTPSRGERSKQVAKGLEFILASSTETGLIAADSSNGPMYGHGFATLFLGEVYGMTQGGGETRLAERTHEALVKAIRLIERSQNNEGGWRYNPVPFDADVSVTICQVMALRSARNAGIEVPKETIDKAVEYVKQCQNSDGGFRYQLTSGFSAWPRSAAGVAALFYAGIYKDEAIDKGTRYLMATAMPGQNINTAAHYFYGHYYSVQAMYLAGGEAWARWWPNVRSELLRSQRRDGAWDDPSVGPAYGTAMALIVLQMPKRFLPIFQK